MLSDVERMTSPSSRFVSQGSKGRQVGTDPGETGVWNWVDSGALLLSGKVAPCALICLQKNWALFASQADAFLAVICHDIGRV